MKNLQEENESLRSIQAGRGLDQGIQETNVESSELLAELNEAQETIEFQSKKIENLKNTRDQLQEQLDKLGSALYNLDGNNSSDTSSERSHELISLREVIAKLEGELAAVSEESEVTRLEADMMIKQIDEIESEKIALERENQSLQQEVLQYTSSESAASSRASVDNCLTSTNNVVQRADSDVDEASSQADGQAQEVEKLKKSLNKMKKKCAQYEAEAEEQELAFSKLMAEKETMESNLKLLMQEKNSKEGKDSDEPAQEEVIEELERRIGVLLGEDV
jgi:chromosome segregation ATPase